MFKILIIRRSHNKTMNNQLEKPRNIQVDKFVLYIFNFLSHNDEISGLLVANTLLRLPKYYIKRKSLKCLNFNAFSSFSLKIIFNDIKDNEIIESLISFDISTAIQTSIFKNYFY